MVHVRIASLSLDTATDQPVIILRPLEDEPGDGRLLPIWIGHPEATAILLALQDAEVPRPMTHDLMAAVVESLDAVLERVEVTRVEEGTFYAALILATEGRRVAVDARPSDSIALAVRLGAPIYVADEVMDEAGVEESSIENVGGEDEEAEVEQFREFLEHVDPSDFQS